MVITYYGKQYCKLTLGDLTIAINPPAKTSKAMPKPPRFGADIVLITTNHPDYNGVETVTMGDKEPFVIDGPGSYEVKECFITGAKSTVVLEGKEYINTVYGFELDGIKVVVLGALSDVATLSTEAKEIAGASDLLFIPIDGGDVFDTVKAYKAATSFSPSILIPMASDESLITRLLKEAGQDKTEMADKATLKRKDLEGKESFIVALTPQA
ncbi:MAG: MBL fold metallo-hydrolase [Candidatus Pacebacteria bacterium]|nr:MBL fold metallo-hydrolase [Candidatus Paceibacterota bacterium]